MFHRDARGKEKEEEIRVRVYGVQAAISSLGSSMIVHVYDCRTTRTIYVHTIAATTFLKYVHRLCLRLESLMIFSGRAKWAAQSFERKTGREFRRTRWIEKERKRERKREDRKISSRMVGRAAIERANSREREGKRKEEEGEFRSAVRIVWVDGKRRVHGCNHVSRLSKITIIQEIGKSKRKWGWEKRFFREGSLAYAMG